MKPTRSRSLIALAIAGTLAWASAHAGGSHTSVVQTPANISESAPSQSGQPHLAGWAGTFVGTPGFQEGQHSDGPYGTGTSTSQGGGGSGGFESNPTGYDNSRSDAAPGHDRVVVVEYWLISEPAQLEATGVTSALSASGSGGYDSSFSDSERMHLSLSSIDSFEVSMGGDDRPSLYHPIDLAWRDYAIDAGALTNEPLAILFTPSAEMIAANFGAPTPLLSEHYLMVQPPSEFDPGNLIVLELGTAADDIALLQALSKDFYVLTPAYDEG